MRRAVGQAAVREEFDIVSQGARREAPGAHSPASSSISLSLSRQDYPPHHSAMDPNSEVNVVIMSGAPEHETPDLPKDSSEHMLLAPWIPQALAPMMLGSSSEVVEVFLNIYDIGTSPHVQLVNTCLHGLGTGLFHCGVEVYELEWSYAATRTGAGTGVFFTVPRECEEQSFRESVALGRTKFSIKGVQQLLHVLEESWPASDYDVLTHNCCHFCIEFCKMLGVGPVPERVINLADASACMVKTWDAFCCKVAAEAGLACNLPKGLSLPSAG